PERRKLAQSRFCSVVWLHNLGDNNVQRSLSEEEIDKGNILGHWYDGTGRRDDTTFPDGAFLRCITLAHQNRPSRSVKLLERGCGGARHRAPGMLVTQ